MHHPDCPRSDPTRSNAPCLCSRITAMPVVDRKLYRGLRYGAMIVLPIWVVVVWLIVR